MQAVVEETEGVTAPDSRAWFRLSGVLVVLSGVAMLAGFVGSLIAERFLGAPEYAAITAALGLVSGATLPAGLLVLPVAGWAAHGFNWRRYLPVLQVGGVVLGGGSVLVATSLIPHSAVPSWVPLLAVLGGAAYVSGVSTGVLLGRQAFLLLNAIGTGPNVFRVVGLAVLLLLGLLRVPTLVIAAYMVASAVAALLVAGACYTLPDSGGGLSEPKRRGTWASAWVALMATLWTGLDVTIAYHVLPAVQAGEYAVLSLIAKTPFYIGGVLANMSIGEAAWGKATMRKALLAIGAVGLLGALGALAVGGRLLLLARVAPNTSDLLVMMIGNTALCVVYLVAGVRAQRGTHVWWIGMTGFLCWTALALSPWVSVTRLAWGECGINVAAAAFLAFTVVSENRMGMRFR